MWFPPQIPQAVAGRRCGAATRDDPGAQRSRRGRAYGTWQTGSPELERGGRPTEAESAGLSSQRCRADRFGTRPRQGNRSDISIEHRRADVRALPDPEADARTSPGTPRAKPRHGRRSAERHHTRRRFRRFPSCHHPRQQAQECAPDRRRRRIPRRRRGSPREGRGPGANRCERPGGHGVAHRGNARRHCPSKARCPGRSRAETSSTGSRP